MKARLFKAQVLACVEAKGTMRIENGLCIYTPPKTEWKTIRTFTVLVEAGDFLLDYVSQHGIASDRYRILRCS